MTFHDLYMDLSEIFHDPLPKSSFQEDKNAIK